MFLKTDTPKDRTANKAIRLSFRLPWTKVHLGSSDLWLLWFAWVMLETTMGFIARWPITYFISVVV